MKKQARHPNKGLRKNCDCPRRNWAKCPHSWHFNFKPRGGQGYRFSLDKYFNNKHIDSKSEAEELAGDLRKLIRAGKFGQPVAREDMTLRQFADIYLERYVRVEHPVTERDFVYGLNAICKAAIPLPGGGGRLPFGDWRVADIVTDTILRFRETRTGEGTGVVGINRNLRRLRAMYAWAIPLGIVERTPFKFNG